MNSDDTCPSWWYTPIRSDSMSSTCYDNYPLTIHFFPVKAPRGYPYVDQDFRSSMMERGRQLTKCSGVLMTAYLMKEAFELRVGRSRRGHQRAVVPLRTSRSLCPRARSTRRSRTTRGVITRLRWRSPRQS